jgi:hypothetical protein
MSKLLNLKEWLTVKGAAKRLSISADEKVKEADVLRLALDGHLTLSVYFVNHAVACRGELVSLNDTNWKLLPPLLASASLRLSKDATESDPWRMPWKLKKLLDEAPESALEGCMPLMTSLIFDDERFVNLEEETLYLRDGIWDLPMVGNERLDIEHAYQRLTKGPAVTLEGIDGAFVCNGAEIYQLQESFDDNPYAKGSIAWGERLLTFIRGGDFEESKINELLAMKNSSRQEFIEREKMQTPECGYYPAGGLPPDSVLVVRTSALRELEQKMLSGDKPEKPEKPLHPSERKSVSQIIAALASMAGLDLSAPYAADETLRASAATDGLELPSSPETVVKFLKAAATKNTKY